MQYYKIKNGNVSIEYMLTKKLNNIEKKMDDKEDVFLCSVCSSLIASILANTLESCDENQFLPIFLVLVLVIYLFLRILLKFFNVLKLKINEIILRDKVECFDEDELRVKDFFYHVIINEVIWGISLINRIKNIYDINEYEKYDLCIFYAHQAYFCFEKVGSMLMEEIFVNDKARQKRYCDVIGTEVIKSLIKTILDKLDEIARLEEYDIVIDIQNIKGFYGDIIGDKRTI